MYVLASLEYYFTIMFCAVLWATAPGLVAVLPMWDSTYVSGTVAFQAIGFPLAHTWQESGPTWAFVVHLQSLLLVVFVVFVC